MALNDKVLSYFYDPCGVLYITFISGNTWKYGMSLEQFASCIEQSTPLNAIFEQIRTNHLVGIKV